MLDEPVYLNRLSGIYLRGDEIEKAIVITELNSRLFPDNGNIWDTMGDVYFAAKQNEKAKDSYKKALKFKPENDDCFWCDNSTAQLIRLEAKK
ncbi:MAG: tetratricopeptide repeat protein [Bacteroidetes bacterium]|nr:tetratricopeptide repeat protein [Bacteroidota bacterium]